MKNNFDGYNLTQDIFKMLPEDIAHILICNGELRLFKKNQLDLADEDGHILPVEELYNDLFTKEEQ
jgi:hypothetical protein